jgi:hypothetical protein
LLGKERSLGWMNRRCIDTGATRVQHVQCTFG